jgi:exopolysaccharide biosynthesis polyprenyl glycosylphosphotransferase
VGFGRGALLVKRGLDILGAVVGLTLGAPLLALIALAVRLDSPGPIVFHQTRVGVGGRLFEIYKFRSMRKGAEDELERLRELNEADGPLFKISDDPRLTRVGRFLRRISLDELPQLWNVLRGEMSLAGPRPPIPAEVEDYAEWHRRRLEVRPGMTGLSQVSGRSLLSFDEMVLLDIYYIENWSLWLDLKILLRTIPIALRGDGAY